MFHIDDVPSGAGEGIKDVRKALAVSIGVEPRSPTIRKTLLEKQMDHFWITLQFLQTITWSQSFMSTFYTFAVFSRLDLKL